VFVSTLNVHSFEYTINENADILLYCYLFLNFVLRTCQVKLDISPLALEAAEVMLRQVLEQKKMSQGLST